MKEKAQLARERETDLWHKQEMLAKYPHLFDESDRKHVETLRQNVAGNPVYVLVDLNRGFYLRLRETYLEEAILRAIRIALDFKLNDLEVVEVF